MHLLVSASAHFAITPDAALWTSNASLGYSFWSRYLDVFDEVRLLVRSRPSAAPPDGWQRATGAGIVARPLPDSVGPGGFARNYTRIAQAIRRALAEPGAVQLRVPCHIGSEVWRRLRAGQPYGVEVVGDPYDVFAPGSVRHPLRPFFRRWSVRELRRQCAGACGASYVTAWALQRRYPASQRSLATSFSDVELPDAAFVPAPRPRRPEDGPRTVVMVGTLAQLYKAPDVLIDAVAACVRAGLDLRLRVVGDGKHRPELEARAVSQGLGDRVRFSGHLNGGDAVRRELDEADLFALPSHQEGLPRAMIEAMARALPCVGSTVGGIPELLPPDDLVPPGDVAALARTLAAVVSDADRMAQMSARNLARARAYGSEALRPRRIAFYQHLQAETSRWLQAQPRHGRPGV
jgi:glycosyltransferase involved in cell wall biosynthesis